MLLKGAQHSNVYASNQANLGKKALSFEERMRGIFFARLRSDGIHLIQRI